MDTTPDRPRSTEKSLFRFCPACGAQLSLRSRRTRLRPTCPTCGFVQYRNPVVGVAAVLWEADLVACLGAKALAPGLADPEWRPSRRTPRVLLARRVSSARSRTWCIPCGYVEFDEEVREALVREIEEETGLAVRVGRILKVQSNFHDPDRQSVGIWFRAAPLGGCLRPGDDVDRLMFFPPGRITVPLAFPTDAMILRELARRRPRNSLPAKLKKPS